jgi:hypothetical protein
MGLTAKLNNRTGFRSPRDPPPPDYKACTTIRFSKTSPFRGEPKKYRALAAVSTSISQGYARNLPAAGTTSFKDARATKYLTHVSALSARSPRHRPASHEKPLLRNVILDTLPEGEPDHSDRQRRRAPSAHRCAATRPLSLTGPLGAALPADGSAVTTHATTVAPAGGSLR